MHLNFDKNPALSDALLRTHLLLKWLSKIDIGIVDFNDSLTQHEYAGCLINSICVSKIE